MKSKHPERTYRDYLRRVPLFAGLTDDQLDQVARWTTDIDLDAGKVLVTEGARSAEMMIIVDGSAEVTRGGEHIADVGPGAVVGEMGVLANTHRNSTVTATSHMSLIHISATDFASVLEAAPQIAATLLPVVAQRLAETHHDDVHH